MDHCVYQCLTAAVLSSVYIIYSVIDWMDECKNLKQSHNLGLCLAQVSCNFIYLFKCSSLHFFPDFIHQLWMLTVQDNLTKKDQMFYAGLSRTRTECIY